MKIEESILTFYQHLLNEDVENKSNWMLHKNGMCNSISRNPDEGLSLWILVKKNFVEIVALIETKTPDLNIVCSANFEKYLNENNINGLYRLDNTVDEVKFRSKRRSRQSAPAHLPEGYHSQANDHKAPWPHPPRELSSYSPNSLLHRREWPL